MSSSAQATTETTDSKALATLRARLALAGGFELTEMPDGSFCIRRWNSWTQFCRTLDEVEEFVERVEQMR